MATRFHFPNVGGSAVSGAVPVSPALQSYSHSAAVVRQSLRTLDNTPLGSVAVNPDVADHLVAGDSFIVQFVSAPLGANTFTAGDAFDFAVQALEANADNNLQLQIFIGLVSRDGGTALGTLRSKVLEGTELATSSTNRYLSSTLSGSYTTTGGERLVVEFSVSGTPAAATGTQGHNGTLRLGGDGAGGDLPENDTDTGTTLNPWLEFANTITFEAAEVMFKMAGAGVATEASLGALSPPCPPTVDANDILIAHCGYEGTTETPSTPLGWEILGGSPYTIESAHRHWLFGKIADGTEDGLPVLFGTPAVTTMRTARVYSFSGYVSGTITDVVPAASFAHLSHATDPQMPTVATTIQGGLAVACIFQLDDNVQANATGETGGDWANATPDYRQSATTPDSGLGIQTCLPTSNPGTVTGGAVATVDDPCGVIGFEIRPSVPISTGQPTAKRMGGVKFAYSTCPGQGAW